MSSPVLTGQVVYTEGGAFWRNLWNELGRIAGGISDIAATVAPYAAAGLAAYASSRQSGGTRFIPPEGLGRGIPLPTIPAGSAIQSPGVPEHSAA